MKSKFIQILIWLGVMAGCTTMAMVICFVFLLPDPSITSLKWQQFVLSAGMLLFPPIICAILLDKHQPLKRLKLNKGAHWSLFLLGVALIIVAVPAINYLAELNSSIQLPKSLDSIEKLLDNIEQKNKDLMKSFIGSGSMLINLGLIALLPALAEELTFRGTLQQILGNRHIAIWISAIAFGAIHMNFHQFIPLTLMGAMFGYVLMWSGSLWIPIAMHFSNNALVVILYYIYGGETKFADTIGAGETAWVGVLSLVITSLGLLIFYRRTHRR